jgi:large subunit ribosomal protein L30
MADKTTRTIRIKWVRSGIGFPRRQKIWVRSLGLKELNQVVERPDTPQIRGLVARAHHLVEIVGETPARLWASKPEYTVLPREMVPVQAAVKSEEATEQAAAAAEAALPTTTEPLPAEGKEEAIEAPMASDRVKSRKPAGGAAGAKVAKPAKDVARKAKKPGKETAPKPTRAHKGRKK